MLFEIFIQIPSLVMAELAWCIRCMFIVAMFAGLILVVVGAGGLYVARLERGRPAHWSEVAEHLVEVQP